MALRGVLYAPSLQPSTDPWPCYNLRGVYGMDHPDYRTRALIPVYTFFEARRRPSLAGAAVSVMMDKWPEVLWVALNARVFINETAYNEINAGSTASGRELLCTAVALFPDNAYALSTLGVLSEKQNDLASAEQYNRRAILADASFADAYYNLMVLAWKKQDWGAAAKALEQLQAHAPNDPRPQRYLPQIMAKWRAGRKT